jgi:hypothetical protein
MTGGSSASSRARRPSPRGDPPPSARGGADRRARRGLIAVVATIAVRALSGGDPEGGRGRLLRIPHADLDAADPAQRLLKTAADPGDACAVSFAGDGITQAPMLQTEGVLYTGLPIPERAGAVFAGWYPTRRPRRQAQTDRVNGSQLTACTDHQRTLYAAWTTPSRTPRRRPRSRS